MFLGVIAISIRLKFLNFVVTVLNILDLKFMQVIIWFHVYWYFCGILVFECLDALRLILFVSDFEYYF